jgi:chromosome partitioning protein
LGDIVACANQKGGVGKTTTVVNLATYLALSGDRVLIVDLDPQGNATSGLGIDRTTLARSVYDGLVGSTAAAELALATSVDGLSILPSAMVLAGAEVELATASRRERRLVTLLEPVRTQFDTILVDCPPSLGLLTVNALTAADAVLVPIQCEYYALEGVTQLIATVNLVRDHLNPDLDVSGVILTMYDGRTKLSGEVAAEVRRHLGAAVYSTAVPRSVRLTEAPGFGAPIALYRPESKGAVAYREIASEYAARRASRARSSPSTGVIGIPIVPEITETAFAEVSS